MRFQHSNAYAGMFTALDIRPAINSSTNLDVRELGQVNLLPVVPEDPRQGREIGDGDLRRRDRASRRAGCRRRRAEGLVAIAVMP